MSRLHSELVDSPLAGRINYAQCWEDEGLLLEALDIKPGDRVVSIASAGDNSIALALAGAGEVLAVDLSFPQLALTELKLAGGELLYEEYLQVLGLLSEGRRVFLYHKLREHLGEQSRAFWDQNEDLIRQGLLGQGRFERYLATFRKRVLPLVHGKQDVRELLELQDLDEQRRFYDERWDGRRWRAIFRLFFSQAVMQRLGRDPAQFAHVHGPVSEAILSRTRHALTEVPVGENFYLEWLLTGTYGDLERSHAYLSRAGHARLKELRPRVKLLHQDLESTLADLPENSVDAFNFSNLFEYVSQEHYEAMLELAIRAGKPGARLAYWNLLVPRACPERLQHQVACDARRDQDMLERDRAFFYQAFHVETLR